MTLFLRSRLLLVAVVVLLTSPASAVLIDNGITMIDTGTNMEWLDLTQTVGQTPAAALAAVNALPASPAANAVFPQTAHRNVTINAVLTEFFCITLGFATLTPHRKQAMMMSGCTVGRIDTGQANLA